MLGSPARSHESLRKLHPDQPTRDAKVPTEILGLRNHYNKEKNAGGQPRVLHPPTLRPTQRLWS